MFEIVSPFCPPLLCYWDASFFCVFNPQPAVKDLVKKVGLLWPPCDLSLETLATVKGKERHFEEGILRKELQELLEEARERIQKYRFTLEQEISKQFRLKMEQAEFDFLEEVDFAARFKNCPKPEAAKQANKNVRTERSNLAWYKKGQKRASYKDGLKDIQKRSNEMQERRLRMDRFLQKRIEITLENDPLWEPKGEKLRFLAREYGIRPCDGPTPVEGLTEWQEFRRAEAFTLWQRFQQKVQKYWYRAMQKRRGQKPKKKTKVRKK